jgi:hypothetical protein
MNLEESNVVMAHSMPIHVRETLLPRIAFFNYKLPGVMTVPFQHRAYHLTRKVRVQARLFYLSS